MEQKDYLILAGVVILLAALFGYFFLFRNRNDFKTPVMDASNIFVSLNKINDVRPAMIYVHNGCPCLKQPLGQTFQNLAIEMQAYGSFYQMKANQTKIQSSFSPPYIAFFVGGQLITGFQAGTLQDLQAFFLKILSTITGGGTDPNSKVSGVVPTPAGTTPAGTTPAGDPISSIISGILGGGGTIPGAVPGTTPGAAPGTIPAGPIADLIKGLVPGGNTANPGILSGVIRGVSPIANTVLTTLSTADIRQIIDAATSFDTSGIAGTITGAIPDSVIELARNFLIGLTRAQSLYIGV